MPEEIGYSRWQQAEIEYDAMLDDERAQEEDAYEGSLDCANCSDNGCNKCDPGYPDLS